MNSVAHHQTFITVTRALQVLCWRLVFRPNCCMHDVSLNSSVYVTCPPPPPHFPSCGEVDRHGEFSSLMFLPLRSKYSVGICSIPFSARLQAPRLEFCNRNVYISYMTPDCLGIDSGFVTHVFPFCLIMVT